MKSVSIRTVSEKKTMKKMYNFSVETHGFTLKTNRKKNTNIFFLYLYATTYLSYAPSSDTP